MEKVPAKDTMGAIKDIFKDLSSGDSVTLGILSVAGILVVHFVVKAFGSSLRLRATDRKIAKRREEAAKKKEAVQKQFSNAPVRSDIVDKTAAQLVEEIKAGKLKAVDVLHAYQRKAFEENTRLNFMTEPIVEAEQLAKELDSSTEKNGLLYGVPFSVKENVFLKGHDCTSGMAKFINVVRDDDAVIVKVLKKHGAIPFVRTNMPQCGISYCCDNPIWGETSNPQDLARAPGGSSGGEGAVIGAGASVIGVGNDIGGSLRIPAEFCGGYSLRPTVRRISTDGLHVYAGGDTAILPTHGPMTRDFSSLVLMTRAMMSPEMYETDPTLPGLPFDLKEYEKKGRLRIGYFSFDGMTKPHPSQSRAVEEAKALLEKMGHQLVPFEFPEFKHYGKKYSNDELYLSIMSSDRGEGVKRVLVDDRKDKSVAIFGLMSTFPTWIFRVIRYFIGDKDRHYRAMLGMTIGYNSVADFFEQVEEKMHWEHSFFKTWQAQKIDALLCPVFATPPGYKDIMKKATAGGSYTQLFNSLDYPSGVIPVTKVSQTDVKRAFDPNTFSPDTALEKLLLGNAEGAEGLSVGVQVAVLPFKEELCLRVMRDLNTAMGRAS